MHGMIGKDVNGFHIVEKLGEGGMADVYKALDLKLDRHVAIKFLRSNPKDLKRSRQRFEIEAKALAKLRHPNIVSVLGYGEFEDQPYLVMEYVSGGTLKQRLGKPMPWSKATGLLSPIARALHYAHEKKIIHRDVKPSNILIAENGEPMLSDFGVAKILGAEETMDLTSTSVGVGTPYYMSPEQGRNKEVGPKSDVYSLGVVLYELVTGRKLFDADTPFAVLLKHIEDPIPNPRLAIKNLPAGVERLILKALSKDPRNRFEDMAEMAAALGGVPVSALRKPVVKLPIKNLLQLIGGVATLLLIVWLWSWVQQRADGAETLLIGDDVLFSDDFENELDNQKWRLYAPIDSSYISFSPTNGFQQVDVQTFSGDKDAGYTSIQAWPLTSITAIEARLSYDKPIDADWLAAGFGLYANDSTHIICDIKTQKNDNTLQCTIVNWNQSQSQTLFDGISIPAGKWVDVRLQIDRGPIKISLYVNDELVGSEYPAQPLLKYLSQPFRPYFNVGTTNLREAATIRYDHIIVSGTSASQIGAADGEDGEARATVHPQTSSKGSLYDDFGIGTPLEPFDSTLWKLSSWDPVSCEVEWTENYLVFSRSPERGDAGCAFEPIARGRELGNTTEVFEAKIGIGAECKEIDCQGFFGLTLGFRNGWLACTMVPSTRGSVSVEFNIHASSGRVLYHRERSVSSSQSHTIRLEINKANNKHLVSCFLDGTLLGYTTIGSPIDGGYFQMGWGQDAPAMFELDDVVLWP